MAFYDFVFQIYDANGELVCTRRDQDLWSKIPIIDARKAALQRVIDDGFLTKPGRYYVASVGVRPEALKLEAFDVEEQKPVPPLQIKEVSHA